ncbi:MAG: DUF4838 domain-containing protein [Oscillospiraceae bacterium]|nr:DUF4838 domain-containing protein [Oscillospiraceae bacterium]
MKLKGYQGTIAPRTGMLYEKGATQYRIVLPEGAGACEQFAASELRDIFAEAGVQIAVTSDAGMTADPAQKVIALGDTVYFRALGVTLTQAEYKFDGYVIESVGEAYVIKGVTDTGTCFGVYGFAEYAMGRRYYAEDEHTVAPSAQNLEFHIKDIPSFFGRYAFSWATEQRRDHSFRMRVNGEFCLREERHGEATPWATLEDQSYAVQILDYTKYRAAHPDWFYLDPEHEGKKPPTGYPQICFSKGLYDEEFFDTFLHELIDNYIVPEKDKVFFMLGISDNRDFCNCPACRREIEKYTHSGLSMRFVNKVADAVEAWRRENAPERVIYLWTFAYLTIFDPPVREENGRFIPVDPSVVARDNVVVRLAPIRANYCYPLLDAEHNEDSRRSFLGWRAVAKHFAVWDYRQDFRSIAFPYPSSVTAQANHELYREMQMLEVFNQAQHWCPGSPFMEMDDFARARMHWDETENYDELTAEFRAVYYKEAEPAVTEYLHAVEAYYPVMERRGWTGRENTTVMLRHNYYRPEEMQRLLAILQKGLAAAKSQTVYDRVNALTVFPKAILAICFPTVLPQEEMLALIDDLRALEKKLGMTHFMRATPLSAYLTDAEAIARGAITAAERQYPLKE